MRVLLIISIAVISFQSTYGQKQAGSFFRLLQFYNERDELQYFPLPSMILVNQRTNCFFTYPVSDTLGSFRTRLNPGAAVGKKTFLTIHGNVLYDLNYNSRIDTPYFQNDVYQHTVQTYLSVTIREKYPVRVAFTVSFGNSNVFSNFSNLNLQFDRFDFTKGIKQKLYKAIPVVNSDSLTNLQKIIDEKAKVLSVLTNGKRNPAYLQKQVEALERDLYLKKVAGDSVAVSARPKDSTLLFAADKEYREKRLIDSLRIELQELQGKYRALRSKAQLSASNIKDRIEKATTAKELKQLADETGLGDTILPSPKLRILVRNR